MKQAIILAGGKGTRLAGRLNGLPKPLIDICGKPLLERQIELLKRYGYDRVLLLVHYGAEQIINFCASRNNWDMQIDCLDDGEPLGTAGATLAIFPYLEENFLVIYGDTMLEVDLARFEDFHNSFPDADATLFLHPNDHPYDSDLVDIDGDNRIRNFYPYPHTEGDYYPNLVNAALYYFRRKALKPWLNSQVPLDFGKDIFPAILRRKGVLLGYNSPEYIKDCGTPARLDKVCIDLTSGSITRSSLNVKQAAVFIDRDGTLNREVGHISNHEQLELLPGAGGAIKRLNHSIYRAIVITNQPVLSRGDCTLAELEQIHNKMETLLGLDGAYLDKIYYCPHHPDRGYAGEVEELKLDCNCRKPHIGMVERAKKELNIETEKSWLIGDSTVDLLTAHRAGLRSILVETGFAGLDQRFMVQANFISPDLQSAVNFILEDYPRLLDMCDDLCADIKPGAIVLIGGLSRSGKSNLASCLRDSLKNKGQKSLVISVDRWLRNYDERLPGVFGRYAMDEISSVLANLIERTQPLHLRLPNYNKIIRERISDDETISIDPSDVIIIEGTVSLALSGIVPIKILKNLFVEIDEERRKDRIIKEYQLRGMSLGEAEDIYWSRQDDETPVILSTKKMAHHLLKLDLDNG